MTRCRIGWTVGAGDAISWLYCHLRRVVMFSIELRAIWGVLKASILWKEVITWTQFLGKATRKMEIILYGVRCGSSCCLRVVESL